METKWFSTSLGQSQHVCIFPFHSSKTGCVESDAFDKSLNDSSSSSMVSGGVVCQFVGSSGGRNS